MNIIPIDTLIAYTNSLSEKAYYGYVRKVEITPNGTVYFVQFGPTGHYCPLSPSQIVAVDHPTPKD